MQPLPHLGFITVIQEPGATGGYLGGYLAVNAWGRPLEFRLSTAVQPTRVHQILYGPTLKPYLFADLIGKTLLEKSSVPVQAVLCDSEELLELRRHVAVPVVYVPPVGGGDEAEAGRSAFALRCHPRFTEDALAVEEILKQVEVADNLREPFARIREALIEARRVGATSRAA